MTAIHDVPHPQSVILSQVAPACPAMCHFGNAYGVTPTARETQPVLDTILGRPASDTQSFSFSVGG
jgi:cytochrome c2